MWQGERTRTRLRYYRPHPSAGPLPLLHCFGYRWLYDDQPPTALEPGACGVHPNSRHYYLGAPPFGVPNGHYCGSPAAWLAGGVRGVDPSLTPSPFGHSRECLAVIGAPPALGVVPWYQTRGVVVSEFAPCT